MSTQNNETRSVKNELSEEVSQLQMSKETVHDWMKFCEAVAEVSEEIQTAHGQDDVDQEAAQFLQENEIWTKHITDEEHEQIIDLLSTSEMDATERSDDHSGPPESKKQRLSASSESKNA